jgi:hypothetical protein
LLIEMDKRVRKTPGEAVTTELELRSFEMSGAHTHRQESQKIEIVLLVI